MTLTLTRVRPINIKRIWPKIKTLLAKSLVYRPTQLAERTDPSHVLDLIKQSKLQLWVLTDDKEIHFMMMTKIIFDPESQSRSCLVWAMAGHHYNEFLLRTSQMVDWAKSVGCTKAIAYTRPEILEKSKVLGWYQIGVDSVDQIVIQLDF